MTTSSQPPGAVAPDLQDLRERYEAPEGMAAARWYLAVSGVGLTLLAIGIGTATAWCERVGSGMLVMGLVFATLKWLQAGWTELDGAGVRTWQRFGASKAVSWGQVREARSDRRRRQLVLADDVIVDLPGMTRRDAVRLAAALERRAVASS